MSHRLSPSSGQTGPEAIFSRYNMSILMTRSMGDRFGPRCCIAEPDITAVTIGATEYARFVIATDGVWDVLNEAEVSDLIFFSDDLQEVAKRIASNAEKVRISRRQRRDDITVIVVDVNHHVVVDQARGVKASCSTMGCRIV